jgi:hypothetical protein
MGESYRIKGNDRKEMEPRIIAEEANSKIY